MPCQWIVNELLYSPSLAHSQRSVDIMKEITIQTSLSPRGERESAEGGRVATGERERERENERENPKKNESNFNPHSSKQQISV